MLRKPAGKTPKLKRPFFAVLVKASGYPTWCLIAVVATPGLLNLLYPTLQDVYHRQGDELKAVKIKGMTISPTDRAAIEKEVGGKFQE